MYDPSSSTREPIPISRFRSHMKAVLDRSDRGGLPILNRRGSRPVALIPVEELAESLERYEFHPEVITNPEDGSLAVWLPEFEIYGSGEDMATALDDLAEEVELYLRDWETHELGSSPNHEGKLGWVRRAQTCTGDRSALLELLVSGGSPV